MRRRLASDRDGSLANDSVDGIPLDRGHCERERRKAIGMGAWNGDIGRSARDSNAAMSIPRNRAVGSVEPYGPGRMLRSSI